MSQLPPNTPPGAPHAPGGFRPEFCPNPACAYHNREKAANSHWFRLRGTFEHRAEVGLRYLGRFQNTETRRFNPCRKIQRFSCNYCHKSGSERTFSIDYWTHCHIDFKNLDNRQIACSGLRQIARDLGVSCRLVVNRTRRIQRNYLTLFDIALCNYPLIESCSFDGYETFVGSQFTPTTVNIMVGKESQVPFAMSAVTTRRKGSMTEEQKTKNAQLAKHWKPKKGAVKRSCVEVFTDTAAILVPHCSQLPWVLDTDECPLYPTALKSVTPLREAQEQRELIHQTTSSKQKRTVNNPLFPSNYIDRELRKNLASQVRETVRFDREMNMAMTRITIALGNHTFRKPYRIPNVVDTSKLLTHGDVARLNHQPRMDWALARLYTHRHVHSHRVSQMSWITPLWQTSLENPPLMNYKTGEPAAKQPGSKPIARHLRV